MKVPFVKLQQRGALMVMFAILLPVMILFVGLALDFGILYLERNKLQDVADATALAGAAHMQDENNGLAEEIARYVKLNDDDFKKVQINDFVTSLTLTQWGNKAPIGVNESVMVEYGVTGPLTSAKFEDNDRVRVRLTKRVPIFFLGSLLGDNDANGVAVSVMAAAKGNFRENPQTVQGGLAVVGNNLSLYCDKNSLIVPDNYAWSIYSNNLNNGTKINDLYVGDMSIFSPNPNGFDTQTFNIDLKNFEYRFSTVPSEYNSFFSEFASKVNLKDGNVYPIFMAKDDSSRQIYYAELWQYKNGKLVHTGDWVDTGLAHTQNEFYKDAGAKAKEILDQKASLEAKGKMAIQEAKSNLNDYKKGIDNKRYISVKMVGIDFFVDANIKENDKSIKLYIEKNGNLNADIVIDNSWLRNVTNVESLVVDNQNFTVVLATSNITYKGVYVTNDTDISLAGHDNSFTGMIFNESGNKDITIPGNNLHFKDDFVILGGKDTILGKGKIPGNISIPALRPLDQLYEINVWGTRDSGSHNNDRNWKIYFGEGSESTTPGIKPIISTSKITLVE